MHIYVIVPTGPGHISSGSAHGARPIEPHHANKVTSALRLFFVIAPLDCYSCASGGALMPQRAYAYIANRSILRPETKHP